MRALNINFQRFDQNSSRTYETFWLLNLSLCVISTIHFGGQLCVFNFHTPRACSTLPISKSAINLNCNRFLNGKWWASIYPSAFCRPQFGSLLLKIYPLRRLMCTFAADPINFQKIAAYTTSHSQLTQSSSKDLPSGVILSAIMHIYSTRGAAAMWRFRFGEKLEQGLKTRTLRCLGFNYVFVP